MQTMTEHESGRSGLRGWLPVVAAVSRRPDLWATAVRQAVSLAPNRWWSRKPFLPLPAPEYLRFRTVTAYGNPDQAPLPHDVITWLSWSRSWKALRSGAGSRSEALAGISPDASGGAD